MLKSWWLWAGAGLGAVAVVVVISQSADAPEVDAAPSAEVAPLSGDTSVEIASAADSTAPERTAPASSELVKAPEPPIVADNAEETAPDAPDTQPAAPDAAPIPSVVASPGPSPEPSAPAADRIVAQVADASVPQAEAVLGESAPEVVVAQGSEIAPVTEVIPETPLEQGPDIVSAPPLDGLPKPVGAADSGVNLAADAAVVPAEIPVAAQPPKAETAAPQVAPGGPDGLVAPAAMPRAGDAPAKSAAPLLGVGAAPLSLAQVLPPGQAPQPGQIAPSFDLVRVAPDGSAIIAGRAAPNAQVQILSGGLPVAEVVASARGEFVVFLTSPAAPTLDLEIPAAPEAAQLVVSQDDIIILPAQPNTPEAAPIVLRRTADAVQIVQPSGPSIPDNISLDLVSYSASGSVVLAGRGQPGNAARIYANGVLAGEVSIGSGGDWRVEINDIAAGRYVLRVDEISSDGAVQSRTESPFQREFPAAQTPDSFSQGAKIIVQPGNTLWLMATEAYGDGDAYTQIFSANKDSIRDPDLIYPGQIFAIPRVDE